jgi:hypothetical protein
MVHRMFRIFYLPVSAANIANNRQQAGADAESILEHSSRPRKMPRFGVINQYLSSHCSADRPGVLKEMLF